ncbi:MAG: hypothetical protein P8X88_05310 [Gammaproteobacteria bacterium]
MRYNCPFYITRYAGNFLTLLVALLLSACASQYVADSDAEQLVTAMQDLPDVRPYLAYVNFIPEARNHTGKVEAKNADNL